MSKKPKDILFVLKNIDDLSNALMQPFARASVIYPNKDILAEKHRWISSVTLWNENGEGVRITPVMNDVADRLEVGSLSFESVAKADGQDEFFELSGSYSNGTLISKIILNESGKTIETGIIIKAPNDTEITIVPNAMPYTLAVKCEEITSGFFEPEYALEDYVVEGWK